MTDNFMRLMRGLFDIKEAILLPDYDNINGNLENCSEASRNCILATVNHRIAACGCILSTDIINYLSNIRISEKELTDYCNEIVSMIDDAYGNLYYDPFYSGFPEEVMELSEAELYMNSIRHYLSMGHYAPPKNTADRQKYDAFIRDITIQKNIYFQNQYCPTPLEHFHVSDCYEIAEHYAYSASSISDHSKQFIVDCLNMCDLFLDVDKITNRETKSYLAAMLIKDCLYDHPVVMSVNTPDDILRMLVAYSKGDVSFGTPTRFVSIPTRMRKWIMEKLDESHVNLASDIKVHREMWLRIGEIIHPNKYRNKYPMAAYAFDVLRNNPDAILTRNAKLERMFRTDYDGSITFLVKNPGLFARNLNRLLHMYPEHHANIVFRFSSDVVVNNVSTNILYQLKSFFENKLDQSTDHIYFIKGEEQKIWVKEYETKKQTDYILSDEHRSMIVLACQRGIVNQYIERGDDNISRNAYIDPNLVNNKIPMFQRSTNRSSHLMTRGSVVALDNRCNIIRAFIHWCNNENKNEGTHGYNSCIDVDLSIKFISEDFSNTTDLSYYNLKEGFAVHSGDFVTAPRPNGACEFVDIDVDKTKDAGFRYAVICVNSFTHQKFEDIPECFVGWMTMESTENQPLFDPMKVQNKINLCSSGQMLVACIIDVAEKKIYWGDISVSEKNMCNNIETNASTIAAITKSIINNKFASMHDVASNICIARRYIFVKDEDEAEVVFTSKKRSDVAIKDDQRIIITAYDLEKWQVLA